MRFLIIVLFCIIVCKSNGQNKLTLDQLVKEDPALISKIISKYAPLDKSDLIKYRHVLDWASISGNEVIKWDDEILLYHQSRLVSYDMEANKSIKWTIPLIEFFIKRSRLDVMHIIRNRFLDLDTSVYTRFENEIDWPFLKCSLYDYPYEALSRKFAYKLDTLHEVQSPADCNTIPNKIPPPLKEKSTLDFIYDHYRSGEMDGFSYDYFYENTIQSKEQAVEILDQLMQQNIHYYHFDNSMDLPYVLGNISVNYEFNKLLNENHGSHAFANNMPIHLMDSVIFDVSNKFQHVYFNHDDGVLIVSPKVKKVLDKCKLPIHKIHTCKLVINDIFVGIDTLQYYYYRFEKDYNDYIDFSNLCVYDSKKFGEQCIDYKMLPFKRPMSLDSVFSCRQILAINKLDYEFTDFYIKDSYDLLFSGSHFLLSPNLVDALDNLNLHLFFYNSNTLKFHGKLKTIEFISDIKNAVDNQKLNEYYKSQYEFANYLLKSKKRVEDVYPDALPLEKKFNVRFPLEYRDHLKGKSKFKIRGLYNPSIFDENEVRSFVSYDRDTIGHYHKSIVIGEDENGSILYLLLKPKSEFELRDSLFFSDDYYTRRFKVLRPMRKTPLKKITLSLSSSNDFTALTNVEANAFLDLSILNLKFDKFLDDGKKVWTDSSSVILHCSFEYGKIKQERERLDYGIDYTFVDTTFTSHGYEINILDFPLLEGITNKCVLIIQIGKKICVLDFQYVVKKDAFPKIVQTINTITFEMENNVNNTQGVKKLPFKIDLSSIDTLIKDRRVYDEGTMYILYENNELSIMKCDDSMFQDIMKSKRLLETMNLPNGLSILYKLSDFEHLGIIKTQDKCMAIISNINKNLFLKILSTIELKE